MAKLAHEAKNSALSLSLLCESKLVRFSENEKFVVMLTNQLILVLNQSLVDNFFDLSCVFDLSITVNIV